MTDIQRFADGHRYHTRVDEDGTKIIKGRMGHIYEYDVDVFGGMIIPKPWRLQVWGFARTAFIKAGFQIVQDGDHEGAATFDPTNEAQVKLAAKYAKVKTRRILSPELRKQLILRLQPR